MCSGSSAPRPTPSLGSCSRRCATARHRMAGLRLGSIGWWRCLAGASSIREVIAFPKTASGGDPLTGAPTPITDAQRAEAGVDAELEDEHARWVRARGRSDSR